MVGLSLQRKNLGLPRFCCELGNFSDPRSSLGARVRTVRNVARDIGTPRRSVPFGFHASVTWFITAPKKRWADWPTSQESSCSGDRGGPEGPPRSPGGQSNISSLRINDGLTSILEGLRRPAVLVRMTPRVGRLVAARAGGRRGALQRIVELVLPHMVVPASTGPRRAWWPRPCPGRGSGRSRPRGTPRSRSTTADRSGGTGCVAASPAAPQDHHRRPVSAYCRPASSGGLSLQPSRHRCRGFDRPRTGPGPRQPSGWRAAWSSTRTSGQPCRHTLRSHRRPSACGCSARSRPSCGR